MKMHISEKAASWYKEEMLLNEGDYVRFFARYGGFSTIHPGFSIGISNELPNDVGVQIIVNGINYYVEEKDLWYFDGHDFSVELDSTMDEPVYKFIQ